MLACRYVLNFNYLVQLQYLCVKMFLNHWVSSIIITDTGGFVAF